MAEGSPSTQAFPTITREPFPTITREEIGNKLRSEYDNVEATKSIDCFYIQAHYPFREWIDAAGQRDIEQKIGEVIETFLQDRMRTVTSEKWSRPLLLAGTVFLATYKSRKELKVNMATSDKPFPTKTREKIGELLDGKIDSSKDFEPIDCFYLQAYYTFRQGEDREQTQREIERVIEDHLQKRIAAGTKNVLGDDSKSVVGTMKEDWCKLTDWWPFTYFLDAKCKGADGPHREFSDRYVEKKLLNDKVRTELMKKLAETDSRFRKVHFIISRACKYTPRT